MSTFPGRLRTEPPPKGTRSVARILDAAARMFGRSGYRGATMTEVAKAAGVSKGLLHYHFESKEHLLIEATRVTFRRIYDHIDKKVRGGDRGIPTAVEALDSLYEAVRDMRGWAPFMVETMTLSNQEPAIQEHLDEFYAEAEGLLAQGVKVVFTGELERLVMPPERLARVIRTNLHGLIVELAYAKTPEELERVDQAYRDMRRVFMDVALAPSRP